MIPVGDNAQQRLCLVERNGNVFERSEVDAVSFVPFCQGEVR